MSMGGPPVEGLACAEKRRRQVVVKLRFFYHDLHPIKLTNQERASQILGKFLSELSAILRVLSFHLFKALGMA